MNSNINTNNLIKDQSEGDGNLTISCNYNLLNNDNTVRWNGDEITLLKPYGLSNVKKICFRGFKGDLLPFTSIDLPNFKVEVVLTGYDVDNTSLIGVDCLYGEKHKYNIDNNGNILLTFDKAWTYNAAEDNQLIYNIKEAVEEVNRRLKIMFPYNKHDYIYNVPETWNENTQQKLYYSDNIRPIGINPGSYIVGIQPNDGLNTISLMYINNNVESFTTYRYGNRRTWYSAVSWDKQIAVACMEYSAASTGTTAYGRQIVWINTASGGAPTYTELAIEREEGWDTRANYFGLFGRSPSMVIGSVGGITSAILSPICRGPIQADSNVIIVRHDKKKYYLDFNKNISNDNILNVLACCDAYDKNGDPINNIIYMVCAYIPKGFPNDSYRVGLFEFDYTTLSQNGNSPTEVISAKAETRLYQWNEFTEFMKFMQCGKEAYKCYYMDIDGDESDVGVWFVGSYMFRFGEMDTGLIPLPAWKLDAYTYLHQNKDNGNYYVLDMADSFGSAENLIKMFNQFYIAQGFNIINNNDVHTANISPPYLLKDFSTNSVVGIVQNPGYLDRGTTTTWNPTYPKRLNEEHIKNAVMCEVVDELKLKSVANYNNNPYNMVMNVDGNATTDNLDFFKFRDDGNILTSQITYEGNKALNMALYIYTDPYYFEFTTPIDYYVNTAESVFHPIVEPVFNTINEHVLNTVETLILLHYEYNNISLVSAQFPNIDGTIFYINEDSYVDFKTMAINNTSDGVRVKLLSNNESLSLTELKALYGKLCVAIDWIQ